MLDFLLYVDEYYVESLYNFYYPNIIETTQGKTKSRSNRIGLGAKLFKSIPIDISTDSEIELSNVSIIESKIKPTIESKIVNILKDKFNDKSIPLVELINTVTENGIYYMQGVFELLTIESKNGNDLIINKKYKSNPKGLVWKLKLITYGESNAKVYMQLGGDKIYLNYHHLTEEIEKYKRFTFNILGKLTKNEEYYFSIKPIVIFYL